MSLRSIPLLPRAAVLALGVLAFSGMATAAAPKELPSVVVKYDDLTLNTRAGVANLHSRLRTAAQQVCSPLNSRVLGLREEYDRCVSDAMSQSVDSVGNSNLKRFHLFGKRAELIASR
jgi:UrcA family protein